MSGAAASRRVRRVMAVGARFDTCLLTDGVLASAWVRAHGGREPGPQSVPRVTTAPSGAAALQALPGSDVDLVIAASRLPDMTVTEFGRRLAESAPGVSLLVLAAHARELPGLAELAGAGGASRVLLWRGDPATALAGIQLAEDRLSAETETEPGDGGPPVILLVEDDVLALSAILPHLYGGLRRPIAAAKTGDRPTVVTAALPAARPRLLAATNFEEALGLWRRFSGRVAGVVTDGEFPRNGRPEPGAGLELISEIRAGAPVLPVLMQSAEPGNAAPAAALQAEFLFKGSADFLLRLGGWLAQLPGLGTAAPRRSGSPATRRSDGNRFTGFTLLGSGSSGMKGRGLALAHQVFADSLPTPADGAVGAPPTLVLTDDVLEEYLQDTHLADQVSAGDLSARDALKLLRRGEFTQGLLDDLRALLRSTREPLAVRPSRSSAGSFHGRPSGEPATVMLPNSHASLEIRLVQLLEAVRVVWANALATPPGSAAGPDQPWGAGTRRTAVVVQRLVGSRHGDLFFPPLSGWAFSHNYYPFNSMGPEDGVAAVMVGWGRAGVEGVRFCPASPGVRPQFSSVKDTLRNAQRRLWALEMTRDEGIPGLPCDDNLVLLDVHRALDAPWAAQVASTYLKADDTVVDRLTANGVPLVTFNRILKGRGFPLPRLLQWLLADLERGMGAPVEVGFAADLAAPGTPLLQVVHVRPMALEQPTAAEVLEAVETRPALVRSPAAMGPSGCAPVHDLVVVLPALPRARTAEAAAALEEFNRTLLREGRSYVLVGPGRWGTRDPWLGIPVSWSQISGVRAIVETDFADLEIEPSQGSHFFHQLTAAGVVFLPVHPRGLGGSIDWRRLEAQRPVAAAMNGLIRHLRPAAPLQVAVDGASRRGAILSGDPP